MRVWMREILEVVMKHPGELSEAELIEILVSQWEKQTGAQTTQHDLAKARQYIFLMCQYQNLQLVKYKGKLYLGPGCKHYELIRKSSDAVKQMILNFETSVVIDNKKVTLLPEPRFLIQEID